VNALKHWLALILKNDRHAMDGLILNPEAYLPGRTAALNAIEWLGYFFPSLHPELEAHLGMLMDRVNAPGRKDHGIQRINSQLVVAAVNLRFPRRLEAMKPLSMDGRIDPALKDNWIILIREVEQAFEVWDIQELHEGDLAGLYAETGWVFTMQRA
jgi:hypothetical protein